MTFAHDTEQALLSVAALVNTAPGRRRDGMDALASPADVARLVTEQEWSGRHDGDAAELAQVRAARERLAPLWQVDRDAAADLVNALLAEAGALPRLARHDGWDWHLHATAPDAPLATRMLVEAAMAMVDVVRSDEGSRLRTCEAADCSAVLVDLSRNRSRRFCDVNGCGNREHVRAYRERRLGRAAPRLG